MKMTDTRSGLPRHQTAYNLVARVAFAWQRSFGEFNVAMLSVMGEGTALEFSWKHYHDIFFCDCTGRSQDTERIYRQEMAYADVIKHPDKQGQVNPEWSKKSNLLESKADGDFGKKSILALQKFLNQEGFYCLEDGDWGNTTEKALQLFLKDSGYDVDFKQGVRDGGKNTELFQEFLLDEEQEIKPDGSWGKKSATALQNFLKSQEEKQFDSLYKGKEDGDMGAHTILALQKFLTQRGCNPGALDSGLGKQTVKALQKFLSMQPDVLELKGERRKKAKAGKATKGKTTMGSSSSAPKESSEAKMRKEMEEFWIKIVGVGRNGSCA
eukprot:symbB.v1.2.013221.t1/scaffold890.1/size154879/7